MTDNFSGKMSLAGIRKVEAIPGMLELRYPLFMEIIVMAQRKFPKGKNEAHSDFQRLFFAAGKPQNNVSFSRKNVLRGLHAEPWDKYISVADEGKVLAPGLIYARVKPLGIPIDSD